MICLSRVMPYFTVKGGGHSFSGEIALEVRASKCVKYNPGKSEVALDLKGFCENALPNKRRAWRGPALFRRPVGILYACLKPPKPEIRYINNLSSTALYRRLDVPSLAAS